MQWHKQRFSNKVVDKLTVDYATKKIQKLRPSVTFKMLFEICEYEILLQIARQA